MTKRLLVVAWVSAAVTFGLFWVMQALVGVEGRLLERQASRVIEFVRLRRDTSPEEKKRELPDRETPEQPPPPPQIDFAKNLQPDDAVGEIVPIVDLGTEIAAASNLGAGEADRDVVPMVRVEPQYPMRAKQRGIEGWVELEFTITAAGSVTEVRVTASHPGSVFDQAAVAAVSKWKYNPRVEDGVAVSRPGVRHRLKFELDR